MLVDSKKVKAFVVEPNLEVELRPLLLFRGNLTPGRAKACFNFLRTAMQAELPTMTEITKASKAENDMAHLCGLHSRYGWDRAGMRGFFSRLLQSPTVLAKEPHLKDYIHWVASQTPNAFLYNLEPISEIGIWSKREWRRPKPVAPMAEVYPFITATPTEDHDLLLAVERLVPKNIPSESRGDLCQDMLVSILTGEMSLDNIKDSMPQYVKRLYKEMPSKYGHLSLDAPLDFGDGRSRTLAETIV